MYMCTSRVYQHVSYKPPTPHFFSPQRSYAVAENRKRCGSIHVNTNTLLYYNNTGHTGHTRHT